MNLASRPLLALTLLASLSWALLFFLTRTHAHTTPALLESPPTHIAYRSPSLDVVLTRHQHAWSAETTHRKHPELPPERQRFMLSPSAHDTLTDALEPALRARAQWDRRSPTQDLASFGLSTTPDDKALVKTLTFSAPTAPLATFHIGAEGYGHRHYYALPADQTSPLLLLDGDLIRLFAHAPTSLIDKALLSTPREHSKEISITYNTKEDRNLSLTHHPSPDPLMRYWSYTSRSPGRSRTTERFASQLFHLKVKGAPVQANEWWEKSERLIELQLTSTHGETEALEIRRAPSTSAEPYLARSTRSRHVVTLYTPVAEELIDLTQKLFDNAATETPLAPPRYEEGDGHSPLHPHAH